MVDAGITGREQASGWRCQQEESAMIRTKFWVSLSVVVGLLDFALAGPAAAHHSFAMFDHERSVLVEGTVTKLQWTNPHVYLDVDAADKDGVVKHYVIECMAVNMLVRAGWHSTTIKPGDKVKVLIAPLLNGQPGGLILRVTLPDGRTLNAPVPAANGFQRTASE
jgi:Family of unknown function (DUF6152)